MKLTKRDVGIVLITLGGFSVIPLLCCGAVTVSSLVDPTEDPSTWVGVTICFIFPLTLFIAGALVGGLLLVQQDRRESLQKTILGVAAQNEGQVTAHEVALHSALTIEAAQSHLDKLAAQGSCAMEYGPDGVVRYVFPRGGIGGTAASEASVWPERPAATEAPAWTEAPVAGERARGGEAGTETRGETVAWSEGIRQEDDSERGPPLQ